MSHPKKANSYDELAELLPAWEKKVRELEKFPQSAFCNDQKIGFLCQLANDDLEQFLSHLSATGGQTYETLRVYAESQIAQKRTAQSYHQGKTSDKKIEKTRGNAMDLGNLDNASKTDDQETRQEEFDPWQSMLAKAPRFLTHQACTPLDTKVKEKEDGPSTATATTGHAWRHCLRLDEAGKAAMAQRKGQLFKGSQKENNGMKGSWNGPSWTSGSYGKAGKGFQTRPWAQTQYGKGFGKQKGLNEVSDWSQDVWDLNGIHALTAVLSQAEFTHCSFTKPRSIAVAPCQPVTVRNIFEVLSLGDEARESRESEFGEKESRDTLQDGACFESVLPHVNNKALKTKLARQKDSPPRGKFTNRFKQSLQDVVQTETISVNGWEEELDQPVAQHPIASLGNLEPSDTGLHQVQDVGGYCWKPVSSIVDSGAINSVAPPDVSSVPMTDSQGSVNGMQYHTADGTRIPNLGQKTFRVGARVRSVPNVSDRRHLSAADLSGRVGGCGQCSGVRSERWLCSQR